MRVLVCGWGEACHAGILELQKFDGFELAVISSSRQCAEFPLDIICKENDIPYLFTDDDKEVFSFANNYSPDILFSISSSTC